MWQPDVKIDAVTYPAGGVAPSTYELALHNYMQKAKARLRRWRGI